MQDLLATGNDSGFTLSEMEPFQGFTQRSDVPT